MPENCFDNQTSVKSYYLKNKNLHSHFDQYPLNGSTDSKKIGDRIEALQISKRSVQTACLYLDGLKSDFTLKEIVPFESFLKHVPRIINLRIKSKKNILLVGRSWWNFDCSRTKVWKLFSSNFSTLGRLVVCFSYSFYVCVFSA